MATHVLYIDDSGTKEYAATAADYQTGRGATRYFVFGGTLISTAEAGMLISKIRDLKRAAFGAEDVEVKSNWLRMPHERKRRYLDAYGISEAGLLAFINRYYDAVCEADMMLMAGVVDKKHMQEKYPTPWYAPAVAYEVVLQRAEQELRGVGTVSVIIDDMSGATPKGNQYKKNLINQHQSLLKTGSRLLRGFTFSTPESLRFVNSARSHLVQVADIVSYNVYRQFVDHGESWEQEGLPALPMYDHFRRVCAKFRCGPSGRIQGYGVVKVPLRTRVRWAIKAEATP